MVFDGCCSCRLSVSVDYVGLHFSLQNHLSAIKQTHKQINLWPIKLGHFHMDLSIYPDI
jgi:hypothetical protein